MKTNSFFNLKRFGLLAKQDLMINRNKYLLIFLMFALGLYTYIVFKISNNPFDYILHPESEIDSIKMLTRPNYFQLFIEALLGLAVYIGTTFSDFGNKVKTVNYLMVPASTFEKFLYPLLFRVFFGLVLFTLIFWVDAQLACLTLMNTPSFIEHHYIIIPFQLSILFNSSIGVVPNLSSLFAILSIGMFMYVVPLFFKKLAFIKAVVSLFVIAFIYTVVMVLLTHLFYPSIGGFEVHCDDFMVTKQSSNWSIFVYYIADISWIFLLLIGYFKLKELKL